MYCCSQDRPHALLPPSVESTEGEFVTVHDFITRTYEWLQLLRDGILNTMEIAFGKCYSDISPHLDLIGLDLLAMVRDEFPGKADRHWERAADHACKLEADIVRR